ncbi:MAG: hypothetical protein GY841_10420 [FCB group bacterium]|nr:hypothetical protein [FCB group bacterium]
MAYGVARRRQLQYGFEAVAGTAIAGDTLLPADATEVNMIQDTREVVIVPVGDGSLVTPDTVMYIPQELGTLTLPSHPFGFDLGNHFFQWGIDAEAATVDTGAGATAYIWQYTIGAATNVPKSATFYGGDNNAAERGNYGIGSSFTLAGENAAALMIGGEVFLRNVEADSFAALTAASNDIALMGNAKLYINDVSSAFGTTQLSGTFHSFNLDVTDTGYRGVKVGDGGLYYTAIKNVGPLATLGVTFEYDANVTTERVDWRAKTPRAVQIKVEGPAVAVAGDNYTYKTLIINFSGVWTEWGLLENDDGDDIMTGTLTMVDNATMTYGCRIICVNELTSV